jgi:hypothetical protein
MADSDDDGIPDLYEKETTRFIRGLYDDLDIAKHIVDTCYEKRFDVVKIGLSQLTSTISASGVPVYSYPTGSATVTTLSDIVVTGVFTKKGEYWVKIRMSNGVYGYVKDGVTTFDNSYKIGNADPWKYIFHDDTIFGDKMARKVTELSYYYTTKSGTEIQFSNISERGAAPNHKGLDIVADTSGDIAKDYPVFATANGTVVSINQGNGYGNSVVILHSNGLYTRSAHFKFTPFVKVNDKVTPYTIIGIVGGTGSSGSATPKIYGEHLHFEVRPTSDYSFNIYNPMAFFGDVIFTKRGYTKDTKISSYSVPYYRSKTSSPQLSAINSNSGYCYNKDGTRNTSLIWTLATDKKYTLQQEGEVYEWLK